jgi:hypothetical protein
VQYDLHMTSMHEREGGGYSGDSVALDKFWQFKNNFSRKLTEFNLKVWQEE